MWRRLLPAPRGHRALTTLLPRWSVAKQPVHTVATRWAAFEPPALPRAVYAKEPLGWWPTLEVAAGHEDESSEDPTAWFSSGFGEPPVGTHLSDSVLLHPFLDIAIEFPPAVEEAEVKQEEPAPEVKQEEPAPEVIEAVGKKGKRTYQPSVLHRKRTHGFMKRNSTAAGRKVLNRRRAKGRWQIAVT